MLDVNWDNKITIKDPYLVGELCDWYGILRTFRIRSDNTKNYINFNLDRDKAIEQFGYLIRRENLDTKLVHHFMIIDCQIKTLFRKLLRTYGISDDEECELTDYKSDTCSFVVKIDDREIDVSLKYPNEFTRKSKISIGDYWSSNEYVIDRYKNELDYELVGEQKRNAKRTSHRSFDTKHYYFSLNEGNENIFIDIMFPEELEDKYTNIYFDNGLLERGLMSSEELPIIDIYEAVVSSLKSMGYKFEDFPSIFIQKTKNFGKENDEVTDRVAIKNGEFESFVYTKGEKKVYINSEGEWSVEDKVSKISDKKGKIDISVYGDRNALMELFDSPVEMYNNAKTDACVVELLSKVLIDEARKK